MANLSIGDFGYYYPSDYDAGALATAARVCVIAARVGASATASRVIVFSSSGGIETRECEYSDTAGVAGTWSDMPLPAGDWHKWNT